MLVVDGGDRTDTSFYLTKALGIGNAPAFQVEAVPVGRVSPAMLDKRAVVILNDTDAAAGARRRRAEAIRRDAAAACSSSSASARPGRPSETDLLPAKLGAPVDRLNGRGGTHRLPRLQPPGVRGVQGAAQRRLLRGARAALPGARGRRRPTACSPASTMAAAAAAERRVGNGRVIVFGTSLDDSWNDLALKPVYLPLVHQLAQVPGALRAAAPWQTVGQVVDLSAAAQEPGRSGGRDAGRRAESTVHANEPGLLELTEQGVYEIRAAGELVGAARPDCRQPRPGRVGSVAARSAGARGGGHRPGRPTRSPRPTSPAE